MNQSQQASLNRWQQQVRNEAEQIANWWANYAVDKQYGGFYGEVSRENIPFIQSPKSIIQNARLLWFFSEYAQFANSQPYLKLATRAFEYLLKFFDDAEHGGVVWQLDHQGMVLDGKKQTYAISFAIYGLSAYYKLTGSEQALYKAQEYFALLENHARDYQLNGYVEALSQDWQPLADVRLSDKDANLPKTMNTHLHVLEAYTALHAVAPNQQTAAALGNLIDLFHDKIIDQQVGHLRLFMDMDWTDHSTAWSYGHDIEASWLLYEAAHVLADEQRLEQLLPLIIQLADTTLAEGVGEKGQVLDQFDHITKRNQPESHWWVQAEALVGFLNGYYLTGKQAFLSAYQANWQFVMDYHKDEGFGEWHYLSKLDQPNHPPEYKAGGWKAPYHNGRAMMEISRLIDRIQQTQQNEVAV